MANTVELFSNQPTTTVTAGGTTAPASGTSESWTVASSASFPAASNAATPPSQFHVADTATGKTGEIIAVTNISGTTWTVTRGAESTTTVAHTTGFTIVQVVSAGFLGSVALSAPPVVTNAAATGTVNLDPLARVLSVTMTGNCTFTFTPSAALTSGLSYVFSVYLAQDATGGRTATWPGAVSWLGGTTPALPATAASVSLLIFETINAGTTWYASAVQEVPALPLAIASGGTGSATQQAAINALTGTQAAGDYLRSDGINATLSSLQAADLAIAELAQRMLCV